MNYYFCSFTQSDAIYTFFHCLIRDEQDKTRMVEGRDGEGERKGGREGGREGGKEKGWGGGGSRRGLAQTMLNGEAVSGIFSQKLIYIYIYIYSWSVTFEMNKCY